MEAGLNLYSIRNKLKTEEEFLETACALKEMGYSYMQFSGSPLGAESVARVVKESGMPVVLTHMPMQRIISDTDKLMEEHDSFGCKNIGLGAMMPPSLIADESAFKQKVEELNVAGEKMQKNGFHFFYHHHHFEFVRMGEETAFDYMIKNAPYINFTADTYWLQYGGVNVAEFLKKLKGRIGCVHFKDYGIRYKEGNFEPIYVPVGDGNMDFKSLIPIVKEAGAEYILVEQDNAADLPDCMEQVKRSIDYLKTL
jgi:sugar phosphate isomerase/epimerase